MYKLDTVVWEITLKCQINCLHCGSKADMNKRPDELTTQEALNLIEQLADLGCRRVVISGGEPFLRKDWAVLGQRVKALGMRLGYITNGFSINDDMLDVLYHLKPHSMSFSLDGATAETHDYIRGRNGVYDHLVRVVERLVENGQFVSIVTSVHKKNLPELPDILKLLLKLGVGAWQLQTATPMGRMPKDLAIDEHEYYSLAQFIVENRQKYKNLIRIMEGDCIGYYSKLSPYMEMPNWQGCQAGLRVMGIESDGSIKGCLSIHGSNMHGDDYSSFIEGNVREKPLKEIWNNTDGFAYNRRFDPSMLVGICKECKYGPICRGGCSEKAMAFSNTPFGSPFCLHNYETKYPDKV